MILITGGGTGGHLSVAKALAKEYNKINIKPIYVGSNSGQDRLWFEEFKGFSKSYFLDSKAVVSQGNLGKIKALWQILKLSFYGIKIIRENNIKKVFSVGGYSAAALSFAAIFARIPLYIHEQNAVYGRLNQILKPFARYVFNSYDKNCLYKDYPIRDEFFQAKVRNELRCILFLGGSQGASFINELAVKLALNLNEMGIKIIHQCGNKDFNKLRKTYDEMGLDVDLFEFSNELFKKFNQADFAISRAGASSLWELCASSLPTLFIPYPYAAKNHQVHNASFLIRQNLAFMILQKDVKKEKILEIIKNADIENISLSLAKIIKPNGARKILEKIENETY